MIIAQISDTHIALDTPDADRRLSDFADTIADINALDPAPDVIIHTGDVVHNGRKDEYAAAAAILAEARAPVYVMVGNKDDRPNLREAFSDCEYLSRRPGFVDYAIEDFPVRLVALDTLNPDSNRGDFCEQRFRNLHDLIGSDSSKPVAVFLHHPPFEVTVGPHPLHFDVEETMLRLRRALQQSGRVVAIFSGHVHRFTAGRVGSIPASVMSAIATTLRRGEYPENVKTRPIYQLHRFDPEWDFMTESRVVGPQHDTGGQGHHDSGSVGQLAQDVRL